MEERWLYYVDDELVQALLKVEPEESEPSPALKRRAVSTPAILRAVTLHEQGRLEEARIELLTAAEDPNAIADVFTLLGHVEMERAKFDLALPHFARACELQPESKSDRYNLAVCHFRLEHWQEALAAFRAVAKMDPGEARALAMLGAGITLIQLEQWAEAQDCFERVLARDARHAKALFGKAVALQMQGQYEQAENTYQKLEETGGAERDEILLNRLSMALARKHEATVERLAAALLERNRPVCSLAAFEALSNFAFAAEDWRKAEEFCEKITTLAPSSSEAWFNLGLARQRLDNKRPAIEAYLQALAIQPDMKQAHANLGILLEQRGDTEGARKSFVKALSLDPHLTEAMWNLGLLLEKEGHSEEACVVYEQLKEQAPDAQEPIFRLAGLHLKAGRHEMAAKLWQECLKRRPDWAEAAAGLGQAYACLKRDGDAAALLEKVVRVLPSPEIHYNLGLLKQRAGQLQEAARLYKEALNGKPNFAEALLNLGHALAALGQAEEAQNCWKKALAAKPEFAKQYFAASQ
jgi:tetratricopeptide (TPR) repeat protein